MAVTLPGATAEPAPQTPAPLYASRTRIYPQRIGGTFRRIKWVVLAVLLGIYYAVPWLRWDRGPGVPDQAVLIDMPGRRAYFLFLEIWPQEIYYLVGLLVLGAIGLFLATAVAGRVWCGFTCPQTVWTDLYMLVERWIEGDRNQRMRRDKAPLSWDKAGRKVAKHAAWLVIAFLTGGAWIMYYNDAPTVVRDILTGQASLAVYGFTALFTATTYLLAGWAREQVCIYMCPWPRIQGAMFDEQTYLVTYEDWRGEPRGKSKRGPAPAGQGDCIDCDLCVNVCPTGIDIRKGQQLACIGCGLCIDACNAVMGKLGRPGNLITYDTLAAPEARARGEIAVRPRLVRPRTIAYAVLMLLVAGVMAAGLATRGTMALSVLPDRAPLYVLLSDGTVQNGYTLRIVNKRRQPLAFRLSVDGLDGARLSVIGVEGDGGPADLVVPPDSVGTFRAFVHAAGGQRLAEIQPIALTIADREGTESDRQESSFHGPQP